MIPTTVRLAIVVLVLAISHATGAADWFVDQKDPVADDRNPGTEAKPFKTIQPAVDSAKSGDTIYIKAGLYSDRVMVRGFGRPVHPIMLTAWKEDRVLIGSELRELPPAGHWKAIGGRRSYEVQMPAGTPDDLIVILDGRPHGRDPAVQLLPLRVCLGRRARSGKHHRGLHDDPVRTGSA